jgi:hypothetical protein
VLGLDEADQHDGRDGGRELAIRVIDILRRFAHIRHELGAVEWHTSLDFTAMLPWAWNAGVVRPPRAELPVHGGVQCCTHIGIVRRTHSLILAIEPYRVGHGPAFVLHEMEAEPLGVLLLWGRLNDGGYALHGSEDGASYATG